ncbi:MAG: pullulanase-type alpha-1,6-glucosidase [Chloroflexi bacterium OHK40]
MHLHRWSPVAPLLLTLALGAALLPTATARPSTQEPSPNPATVTIPGTIQSVLGCPADWQPACANTYLSYNQAFGLWSARFDLPAGSYEYKVALNDSWSENYGLGGVQNGPNIPLVLDAPTSVLFVYDHETKWVADSVNQPPIVAVGDFQPALGCPAADDPECLGSLMQDPDGDGVYAFVTTALPAGDYRAGIAAGASGVIGEGGTPGGPPIPFTVAKDGDEIYIGYDVNSGQITLSTRGAPRGNIARPRAYWIDAETIVWNVLGSPTYSYELHYSPNGGLSLGPDGISGGQMLPLSFSIAGPGPALERFPHLAGFSAFKLSPAGRAAAPEILRGQVAVAARDNQGRLVDAAGLQIPGALDALFPYAGPLGVSWEQDPNVADAVLTPVFRLWAPTARTVTLLRYTSGEPDGAPVEALPMVFDQATGVWQISGGADWAGQYYLYDVELYVPAEGQVVTNRVTDPYSLALSTNSARSQIVNLDDPGLAPAGWDTLEKPPLEAPEEIVLYELHVRDFSIGDDSVPEALRGTFRAFTVGESAGMAHLGALAEAGVTHVHLLPVFDIATIEEDASKRVPIPLEQLAALPPDSPEQQALLAPLRDLDGFNWGYDPLHYTVPEGSYSTDPEGARRTLEFREMVQSLNQRGLRVVMDVVYNHTNAAGQSPRSVLDRIVPGYYHRLDGEGAVANSTCCANTATEHAMMEKLMVDSVVTWARAYKVDGFRFDLMGHHMRRNMLAVRAALDALTLEADGVDGKRIYVYGEGWDFGEVAGNARGENATQLNMAGTGIGTFSDRLRDGARGGGPFDDPRLQGFITGLFTDPSAYDQGDAETQRARLLTYTDWIKLGLAGNLRDYRLLNAVGREVPGERILYNGAPAGYTSDPQEQIVYVSAHDNETLFDAVQLKAPTGASLAERVRMHNLGLSLVALSQGIPFFHAGDELLRSKSLDRNSYNSSDWFSRIDWTGQEHTFGSGLPPAGDNEASWPIMAPLLANPALKPGPAEMGASLSHLEEMLRIRRSTPLFRLRDAEQVRRMVRFFNGGPEQVPGLIVMSISDTGPRRLDESIGQVVVLFNATPAELTWGDPLFLGAALSLHDVLVSSEDERAPRASFDRSAGSFTVPARTTAVFVGAEPVVPAPDELAGATATALPPPTAIPEAPPAQGATAPAPPTVTPPAATAVANPPPPAAGTNPAIWIAVAAGIAAAFLALWSRRRRG